jgi:O-antigen/teichoic acid export membrane protein
VIYVASTDYLLQAFSMALAMALAIRSFFGIPFAFGLNYIYISQQDPTPTESSTHLILSTALTAVLSLAIMIGSPVLHHFYRPEVVRVLIVLAILWLFSDRALASTPQCMLKRELRYARLSALSVISTLTSYALAIGAAFLGLGIWALVIREASKTLINLAGVWILSHWRPLITFDWSAARKFLRQGFQVWFQSVSTLVVLRYDDLIVGNLAGVQTLGYYERAYKYAQTPMGLLSAIYAVTFPTFAQIQRDRAALSKAYTLVLDAIAIIVFPIGVLFAIVAPEFVTLLLGSIWLPVVPMLRALLPYALLRPIGDASFQLPIATGQTQVLPRIAVLQVGAMLLICTPMTYFWGAVGAGLSVGIVQLVSLLILHRLFMSRWLTVGYAHILTWPLVSIILGGVVALGLHTLLKPETIVSSLVLKTGSFGVTYITILWLFQRARLKSQAQYLLERLFKKKTTERDAEV